MKRHLLISGLLVFSFVIMLNTCNNKGDIVLQEGESAARKIDDVKYRLKVNSIEDSRCPKDVKCVRAGEAFVNVSVDRDNDGEQLLRFCTGLDCRRGTVADVNTISTATDNIEIKLLSVTPDPTLTNEKDSKKATFTIKKL